MANVPRIFDSGFLSHDNDPENPNHALAYSAELHALLSRVNTGTLSYEGWEFRREVIRIANRLFGSFNEWVKLQITNDRLTTAHYGLIEDIRNFILMGRPVVELSSRMMMIAYASRTHQSTDYAAQLADKRESLAVPLPVEGNKAVAAIIAKDGGFHYLLEILKYIFGTKKI